MLVSYTFAGGTASEIAAGIETAVAEGALPPGAPLPTVRELAARTGVNANTAASAYRLLRERGVVETAGRRGSRIRPRPASTAREDIRIHVPPGARDLSRGNPDPALLPDLTDALAAAARAHAAGPALYGTADLPDLVAHAAATFEADGIRDGARPAVTSGTLDAVERVLTMRLRPGDAVAVEDPGWSAALDLVTALGLRPVPVPVDDDGPGVGGLERALATGVRAVIVTARAQNPTGAAVSAERAAALRPLLAAYPHVVLVEDDHAAGLANLPIHTLTGTTAHWIVTRSTAKSHGPDLRLAVVTGDPQTVDRLRGRQRLAAGWVSHLLQRTVAHLWQTGAVSTERVAASYTARREALINALAGHGISAHGRSGLNVWIPVADETTAITGLLTHGWAAAPGARNRLATPPAIRVTVAALTPQEIPEVAAALAAAIQPAQGRYG
ncbi:aminotransferase class I/II-fold pyridoxal phosphate-dependent enzyme [Nonomuraea endophytica]|uniref:DNA-binding transcriptional MocR family regulator n=1 Tax=Nonomuraea endophytica TaxID=714136 RepID=A0A7W8EMQ9_9ACTN|nr:aminotransferase class I/II-fold pyridoxal phosphate-dependent enzyme [Nonomuraea endophytica]MBB5084941.1 DNA-binding transcriptional MocR family regulator [Nonomuraea endophytica]